MNDTLISFQVAKLAKEKGFDWKNIEILEVKTKSAFLDSTTQSLLQKWLRDVHNIHIEIQSPDNTEEGWKISSIRKISNPFSIWDTEESFDNYEKALEMGLQATLNLI